MNTKHIQHLFWRAGFGISPNQVELLRNRSKQEIVKSLFSDSKKFKALQINTSEFNKINPKTLFKTPNALMAFNKKNKVKIMELNIAWLNRMSEQDGELRERMTLFWTNHFVCKDNNVRYVQQYNNTLRGYALGNFRDFVKAISKEPAMLRYLNNKQNVKKSPNENFARELMELFTLGEGHYTEKDIKESARAFTGYNHIFKGQFMFRQLQHDYGIKRFFGKRGRFNGDDIIDIILSEEQCARFVCKKIYRYFVNEIIDEGHINEMVTVFYPKYDISRLMQFIFMSDWFYEEENIGVKIKSPIEFLVGINRTIPLKFKEPKRILGLQRVLGQVLFNPPNVAGWNGDKAWIDSNTILLRLRIPSILLSGASIYYNKKGEFNDSLSELISKNRKKLNLFKVETDWSLFKKSFRNVPIENMQDYLILSQINKGTKYFLEDLNKTSKHDHCIQLMSLPEYQMC